jgi:ubiquinone/menaquinone biosynthesis C-methylase UbiE
MEGKARKFWDKQAKRYDNAEKQFEHVYELVIAKTKEYLDSNDIVLDFGCATGTKTLEIAPLVKHIHGLDISTEMIKEAVKKQDAANIKNCSFSQGNIFEYEMEIASYDKIISFGVIHLLEDSKRAIKRIYELLKPGGLFISTTACLKDKMAFKNSLQFSVYFLLKKLGIFPLHLNMFSTTDVEELIVDQNFQIVAAEKLFSGITSSFIIAKKL